jgi:hypothetical protein
MAANHQPERPPAGSTPAQWLTLIVLGGFLRAVLWAIVSFFLNPPIH